MEGEKKGSRSYEKERETLKVGEMEEGAHKG